MKQRRNIVLRARAHAREDKIEREIRLYLNATTRAGLQYGMADLHLRRAVSFGLHVGMTVAIENEKFQLVDNVEDLEKKGAAWRPARFPRYEIKPVKDEPPAKVEKPATEEQKVT